jgi:hypothetical protein
MAIFPARYLPLLSLIAFASAAPVQNWVTTNGDAGFSGGSEATSSPVTTSADADTIAANFPAVTLADGDFLTLTGSVSFNHSLVGNQFRIGLFDGDDPVTAGDGAGYVGIFAQAGTSAGGPVNSANGTETNPFSGAAAAVLGTMSNPGNTPAAGTTIEFSLTITRNGAKLDIAANLTDGGSYNSSLSLEEQDLAYFTYDSVAFLMGGTLNASQAVYSNIEVTTGNDDSDHDGMNDAWELDHGLVVGIDDSALDEDANGGPDGLTNLEEFLRGTDPQDADTDDDDLLDGVESNTRIFVSATDTGTDPKIPDTDADGIPDGTEVANGTDPNDPDDPGSIFGERLIGIDFNRNDQFGAPSQTLCRVISGSAASQAVNQASYTKTIGSWQVTVARPDAQLFEFRGANGDSSRAIPGGDISRSFLVADFIGTRGGRIDITLAGLPAGDYVFRSFHLEPFTGAELGFSQGATTTSPNTIEARIGAVMQASIQPTALGAAGLDTTFIDDSQVPTLVFPFTHDGSGPLSIELHALDSNGPDTFLLLNGFEVFTKATQ